MSPKRGHRGQQALSTTEKIGDELVVERPASPAISELTLSPALRSLPSKQLSEASQRGTARSVRRSGDTAVNEQKRGELAESKQRSEQSLPSKQTGILTYSPEAFLRDLQRLDLARSAIQATDGLLRTWGAQGIGEEERQGEVLDLSQIALARRLEYLPFSGNLNLLTLLDLPVIVELLTPEQKELRFVLLLKINENRCWVLLDDEQEVPLQVISNNWFGRAHLFWRNFEGLEAYLTIGSMGPSVQRLHTLLHQAQVYPASPSTTFDRKTEEAVALFQRTKHLVPDGVVGPFTMIMLYNSLPDYPHPHLTAGMEDPSLHGEEA
jgi:hypothetical protein